MKITDIKQQVKRRDRYSIFIDGKYSFGLSQAGLFSSDIKIGLELNAGELEKLKAGSHIDKAIYRTLDLISRRPRSRWEINDYLKRKKYEDDEIVVILENLSGHGFIDDEDFARRWVENRRLLKQTSKRKLAMELKQKRIDDKIIKQVIAADETDEQAVLAELIAKKRRQTRYQNDQKLIAYLIRQGYNYGDIKQTLTPREPTS